MRAFAEASSCNTAVLHVRGFLCTHTLLLGITIAQLTLGAGSTPWSGMCTGETLLTPAPPCPPPFLFLFLVVVVVVVAATESLSG